MDNIVVRALRILGIPKGFLGVGEALLLLPDFAVVIALGDLLGPLDETEGFQEQLEDGEYHG
jgi:hypothetical protein